MTNEEAAIEVRCIAAVCTPSSAERHRLQDLADRLEAEPLEAPKVLAVWEVPALERIAIRLGESAEAVSFYNTLVTVTITERHDA